MTEVIAELQPLIAGGSTMTGSATTATDTPASNSNLTFLREATAGQTAARKGTKQTRHAKIASPAGSKNKRLALVAAGVIGVVVLLAAIVIALQTGDGTLIVEIDQPDAEVQVINAEGKIVINQSGGAGKVTLSVDPGKHRLKVEKDGFAIFGQDIEIAKGATKSIKARLEPKVAEVVATGPANPTPPGAVSKAPPAADTSPPMSSAGNLIFGGHQYRLVNEVIPWDAAREEAATLGGHLATITSADEDTFIRQQFSRGLGEYRGFWLGAIQDKPTTPWRWVNGEPFSYTNWAPDEPNCPTKVDENTPPYYLNFFRSPTYPKKYGWNDTALGPSPRWTTQIVGYLVEWDHSGPIAHRARTPRLNEPVVAAPREAGNLILNQDLTGWIGRSDAWKVENGELVGTLSEKTATFLYNATKYQDFELSWEVRLSGSCNSGMQFRSEVLEGPPYQLTGPQAEIGSGGKTGYGGLWWQSGARNGVVSAVAPAISEKLVKPNDFNPMTLKCVGSRVTITLNGTTTIDAEFNIPSDGVLGWQMVSHGGGAEARFRNIRLRNLMKPAAN